ncbi:ankyrin repeat domain-containing protein [Postechiella marina]|uniref:Ankyrin repeat domain-containing protein n=1 Tax=Postechiella marina TaxID=943941 RepID=A0ABP8C4S3_9FLAO
MKTIKFSIITLLFVNLLQAQSKNIFWEKSFWKTNPTIKVIEQKIAEGNDAAALNPMSFDAVTNAILAHADNTTIKHLLSKKGNNVNKLTHDKRTYVFWAAYSGNLELVKHLIVNNAKLNIKDSHHFSPLTFAAVAGQTNTEIYDTLIENGIDIKTDKDEHGANALLLLIPHLKDFKLVDYFEAKGLSLKSVDNHGNGAFNYVAKTGNKAMLELLIKKGLPYKNTNSNGGNAMLMATQGSRQGYNTLDFFKHLNSLGIAANITNNNGLTPLHNLAYGNKDLATINYFINKGVDVNKTDNNGNTALINASGRNTLEIITKLANNTKQISHVNNHGQSALTKALKNKPQIVTFLVNKGADVHVIDAKGNNLAYYLVEAFQPKKQEAFKENIKTLSANGFDIKTTQKNGNTLFHLAANANNIDLLKYSNTLNIDINAKNKDGLTALHIAVMKAKNLKTVAYLLSIGADKNIKTDFEESLLDLAQENELLSKQNINLLK